MQRSSSPVFHFFLSHQFFTGLFLGYLLAALILHFQLRSPCSLRAYPAGERQLKSFNYYVSRSKCPTKHEPKDCIKPFFTENLLVKHNCTEGSTALPPVTATISLNASVTSASIKQERILCWVVTTPNNKLKAEAVNNTWGRRCDKLLFMSSQNGKID